MLNKLLHSQSEKERLAEEYIQRFHDDFQHIYFSQIEELLERNDLSAVSWGERVATWYKHSPPVIENMYSMFDKKGWPSPKPRESI